MSVALSQLADKVSARTPDLRQQDGWEELLWDQIAWIDGLDTKRADILFGMVVNRWDRRARAAEMDDRRKRPCLYCNQAGVA